MKTTHPTTKWLFVPVFTIFPIYLLTGRAYAQQLAFPGAEGFGRYSVGGRGGQVIEVTNLNDSGPGSLRAAIDTVGPRTVVFRVSGNIELLSELKIDDPYITIAGQTAPGDGICLKNQRLRIQADHVIIRYIRVRLGDAYRVPQDTVWIGTGHNIILDHCSTSWAVDETLSVAVSNTNGDILGDVTVQWCLITESLNCSVHDEARCHGYGSLNRGGWGNGYTFHHNLYAHHKGRNPYAGNYNNIALDPDGLIFDFCNNVVYNWGSYAGHNADLDSITKMNFVGNYYKRGPDSPASNYAFWQQKVNLFNRVYFSGNMMNGNFPADQWELFRFDAGYTEAQKAAYKLAEPVVVPPVQTDDAQTAYDMVLADAGASFPVRDAVDERDINNVMNGTGQIINCVECNDFYYPSGYAQAATPNSITLTYDYVEDDDRFTGMEIEILAGTGSGQKRLITDYTAATNLAIISPNWDVIPDTTSYFAIIVDCAKNAGCSYPVLQPGTPPADTDHDGMPDYWERALCLNLNDPNDRNGDRDGDGYTNIEEYLNWLPLREPLPDHLDSDGDGKGDTCDECPYDPIDGCVYDGDVIFVDQSAMGANNGSNWQDAYTSLQSALGAAVAGKNIAVAQGTYKPTQGVDRIATFQLISGVGIYGGYPAGGGTWASRNPNIQETILSGDINVPDNNSDNSYHVVTGSGVEPNAILDGFTVTAGNANGGDMSINRGGGMYNSNGSPTVTNCTFKSNTSSNAGSGIFCRDSSSPALTNCTLTGNSTSGTGGGMRNLNSNPTLTNCTFNSNTAISNGGGMHNQNSMPMVINCTFVSNLANSGGGIADINGSSVVTNCIFVKNSANSNGGGMHTQNNSNSTVTNCIFNKNSANSTGGGGMWNNGSNPTVTNCTFTGNSAPSGSGIYDYNSSNPVVNNCIIWGNFAPTGTQIYSDGTSFITVSFSNVQGGWAGTGNINLAPLFVDANGWDGVIGTLDDNLRLLANSPCIDKGSNANVPADTADLDGDANTTEQTPLDLDFRPRFADGDCDGNTVVDMGAYEFAFAYAGDFDSDCDVDFFDFAIPANSWLQNNPLVDITPAPAGDGIVDIKDLAVLCDNWLAGK
jgi:hypothetical protein